MFSHKPQYQIIHKARKENINENGSTNTEDKQTGKPKRDAYCIRSAKLVQKGKEIRNIMGCKVFIDIVLTWENGKRSTFMSERYKVSTVEDQACLKILLSAAQLLQHQKSSKEVQTVPIPMVNQSIVLSAKFAMKVLRILRQMVIG